MSSLGVGGGLVNEWYHQLKIINFQLNLKPNAPLPQQKQTPLTRRQHRHWSEDGTTTTTSTAQHHSIDYLRQHPDIMLKRLLLLLAFLLSQSAWLTNAVEWPKDIRFATEEVALVIINECESIECHLCLCIIISYSCFASSFNIVIEQNEQSKMGIVRANPTFANEMYTMAGQLLVDGIVNTCQKDPGMPYRLDTSDIAIVGLWTC